MVRLDALHKESRKTGSTKTLSQPAKMSRSTYASSKLSCNYTVIKYVANPTTYAEFQLFVAPQNIASIRSVVSVDGEEYDEPIAVDNISVDSVPSRLLPLLNEQMWGPWQGSCQVNKKNLLYFLFFFSNSLHLNLAIVEV